MTELPPLVYDPPREPWLTVLHEDRDLVVIDKPAGLFSVPGVDPAHHDSAYARVLARWPLAQVVHRLDLSTSGLLVFALRRKSEAALRAQFQARTVEKVYVARVSGNLQPDSGEVDLGIEPDLARPPLQRVSATGRQSHTRWTVIAREAASTLVELRPTTGRQHQLRVHLAALGHPILGDTLYGPPEALAAADRLCLHAHHLALNHPYSEDRLVFQSPVPSLITAGSAWFTTHNAPSGPISIP
ncbi:pseudouridine synthase [Deltaproteobacteria bacterium]|nr:pseudouridine synthase [Deltaproteobacteria bacterium]